MEEPVVITYGLARQESALAEVAPREVAPPEAPPLSPPAYPPASFVPTAAEAMRLEEEVSGPSIEELRRQATEEGRREGYDAGAAQAKLELAPELESLRGLGRAVREALAQGIEGLEDVMVEIAFAAACKVLGEAALTEEGIRNMVREAMRAARSKEGLVLRISPRDYELLFSERGRVRPIADEARIEVVADDRVSSGCLIETKGGTLDARLEVQLRQLLDTLTRARHASGDA
jgi:flagellar assembly protein FliH